MKTRRSGVGKTSNGRSVADGQGMEAVSGSECDALDVLPHRFPFRMIDRVLTLEAGRSAVVLKNVTCADPLFDRHGTWARVLLVEIMAQAAGMAAASHPGEPAAGLLVAVNRFRCGRPVVPGDRLVTAVEIVRRFGSVVKARAVVRAGNVRCAAGELLLHISTAGTDDPGAARPGRNDAVPGRRSGNLSARKGG